MKGVRTSRGKSRRRKRGRVGLGLGWPVVKHGCSDAYGQSGILQQQMTTVIVRDRVVEVEHIIADSGNVDGFDSWENQGT